MNTIRSVIHAHFEDDVLLWQLLRGDAVEAHGAFPSSTEDPLRELRALECRMGAATVMIPKGDLTEEEQLFARLQGWELLTMKAFRIQNDIVAALDKLAAIAAWATEREVPYNAAGPVEEIDPADLDIQIEDEDGNYKWGKLAEVMPVGGPAEIIAFGECEDCT